MDDTEACHDAGPNPRQPARAVTPSRGHPREGPLVLLVEDEAGTQDALGVLLRLDGWDVVPACDGEEALAALEERFPDVIVTDYLMPNLDGLELIEQIRTDPRLSRIPIVLMSATGVDREQRTQVEVFLPKPIDLSELREVLAALARRPQRDGRDRG